MCGSSSNFVLLLACFSFNLYGYGNPGRLFEMVIVYWHVILLIWDMIYLPGVSETDATIVAVHRETL